MSWEAGLGLLGENKKRYSFKTFYMLYVLQTAPFKIGVSNIHETIQHAERSGM